MPNRLHRSLAAKLTGRALAEKGQYDEAQEWYENALDEIAGLGWQRTEAIAALEYVSVLKRADVDKESTRWKGSVQNAKHLIGQLRSDDLKGELDRLVDE